MDIKTKSKTLYITRKKDSNLFDKKCTQENVKCHIQNEDSRLRWHGVKVRQGFWDPEPWKFKCGTRDSSKAKSWTPGPSSKFKSGTPGAPSKFKSGSP